MTHTDRIPLYVDLDGTLTPVDTLLVVVRRLLRSRPSRILFFPFWLLHGKAYFKRRIANLIDLDASRLDYSKDVVDFLRGQRNEGRRLILITASDQKHANTVAKYLGLFDQVIGSDGITNYSGRNKLRRIKDDCTEAMFDYAGNSNDDLEIWPHAREAIVVAASTKTLNKARRCSNVTRVFAARHSATLERCGESKSHGR